MLISLCGEKMQRYFYCYYQDEKFLFREYVHKNKEIICQFVEGNFKSIKFKTRLPHKKEISKLLGIKSKRKIKYLIKEFIRSRSCCFPPMRERSMAEHYKKYKGKYDISMWVFLSCVDFLYTNL